MLVQVADENVDHRLDAVNSAHAYFQFSVAFVIFLPDIDTLTLARNVVS
jgi:hypothetical protein